MLNSKERREIAARLRELPSDTYAALKMWEGGGLFIDANLSDEADYSQIHNAIFGYFPAEYMHPGDYKKLHEHLADLIDRPTCNNVSEFGHNTASSFDFICSHCGSRLIGDGMYCSPLVDDKFSHYGIKFCPNCGAEVVE